ncbi:hypothetical protein QYE76_034327 [Lolium multiflorum]|uniref:Reverse transcriptase domain-containing protein n=1 Tax=Lolium multiflorum TaxID=4521 RepID=A0AAD8VL41_LOLMU|nr:hypothetical protein QYE76_034327 [Lolium multiflorum]
MDEDDALPDPKAGSAAKPNPFDKKSAGAYHTFLGTPTVRASKSALRIPNATFLCRDVRWSETPCTFDRKDHPTVIPKECYALVVSPRIDGYDFSKCLMDGGASLNIMYLETLERMNLTKEQLKHSTEFHGVVRVVPFKSSYHVIFGRPTYHKFHARACYIYNKLKIPGPKDPDEGVDQKATSFITPFGTYCYVTMPFGLKNAGATYQRTMQRCPKDQIGRNVHAYVDDIAVMTRKGSDLISDLTETFDNLRRDEVDEIAKCFLGYEVKYVRRDDNAAADMLSKLGSGRKQIPPGIFWSTYGYPRKGANPENPEVAVSPAKEVMVIIPAWTQPFLDYLIDQKLRRDEVLARQIIGEQDPTQSLTDSSTTSATGVFLKCVSSQDGIEILREIHSGDCGHHAAPRSLVAKAFRLGFSLLKKMLTSW